VKLAILITTRNHPQRIEQLLRRIESSVTIPHDVFVAECGPDVHDFPDVNLVRVEDIGHRDDCGGLTLALEAARKSGRHDYYWILTEEVSFDADTDVVLGLIDRLERERLMAIAAPTWNQVGFSPRPDPTSPDGWRAVASCELRGFVMKADAIEDVGFLNTEFVYGVGAMHELCHRLYSAGWFVGRCEDVVLRLNAATVLERKADCALEHYAQACRFAYEWFRTHHGEDWDAKFWAVTRGLGVDENPFDSDKTHWSRCYDQSASEAPPALAAAAPRRMQSAAPAPAPAGRGPVTAAAAAEAPRAPAAAATPAPTRAVVARLNLGSGSDYRPGWINVDLDPISGADLIAHAESLPMFASGSIDVIEARQLLPFLGYFEAQAALREWARLLRPGGELLLELPDLEACVAAIGRHVDERGLDPALTGLYGEPRHGSLAAYRWAWSRSSLTAALREAGFDAVQFEPTNRCQGVTGFARDMRARSKRAHAAGQVHAQVEQVAPATPAPARHKQAHGLAASATEVDISAWPLATDAALRIFAWPDYDHAAELEMMFNVYGRHLIGRRDVCLVLRQDKRADGSASFVRAKLELAHGRSVGRDAEIDVLLVDEDLTEGDWPRLGRSIDCALLLPSSHGHRRDLLMALGVPLVENTDQLLLHLPAQAQPLAL
jgi:hypothetical protein